MPADLAGILYWLPPVLVALSQALKALGDVRYAKPAQDHSGTPRTRTIRLQKIEQREPSRHPPKPVSLIPLICAFLLLAYGILGTYVWIVGIAEFQMGLWAVLFFVGFIGLPLWIIRDHFLVQPKYDKRGRSHVAKEARVTVANDVDTVFDACHRALDSMQAAIRIMEKPNLLKANIRNSMMTITIIQAEGSKARVYALSDSKWLTVRWDSGANQRNIDSLLHELGKQ